MNGWQISTDSGGGGGEGAAHDTALGSPGDHILTARWVQSIHKCVFNTHWL